ncbi:MAG: hypothetical protein COA78_29990 [Blastopirellula sp.]|nr:MAG: hypothetical protein COA78_29990 [Blastopirellula sp.]
MVQAQRPTFFCTRCQKL